MKKYILSLVFVIVATYSFATTYYAVASGLWSNSATWSLTSGGSGGAGVPGTGDDVYTDGFTIFTGAATVRNLYIESATANSIVVNGTLTVEGLMSGHSTNKFGFGITGYDFPTASIIANSGGQIIFTGTALNTNSDGNGGSLSNDEVLAYMSNSVSLPPVTVNTANSVLFSRIGQLVDFSEVYDHDLIFISNLTITSGTLTTNQMNLMRLTDGTLTVSSGANFNLEHGLNETGNTSSSINAVSVNGTISIGASGYLNSDNFNLNSGGTFNIQNNNTNGWWNDAATGPTVNINANSTVNYNKGSDQGIAARTYGNLTISSGGGDANKTLSTTGTLSVQGVLTIGGSNTFNLSGNSNDFTLSGNMVNSGIFTPGGTAVFDGTTVISGSGSQSFNGVSVTGALTTPSTLSVAGDFTNAGTFTNSGTVTFNGTTQALTATNSTAFENLTINSGSNTTISGAGGVEIANTLTVSSGGSLETGDVLTMLSDATGTSRIANLSGATFTGDINYQRYLGTINEQAPYPGTWRNVASPVGGNVTNNSLTGMGGYAKYVDDLAYYIESRNDGVDFDLGWQYEETALVNGRGYSYWTNSADVPGVMQFSGPIETGDVVFNVTYTDNGQPGTDGWNLIANPYVSSINWYTTGWSNTTNVGGVAQIWNGLAYQQISSGGTIASGQGFWVEATANQNLTVSQSAKVATDQAIIKEGIIIEDELLISLSDGTYTDNTKIMFRSDATEEYDLLYDAHKKQNLIFNISTKTISDDELVYSALPNLTCERTVKLNVTNINEGSYTLDFSNVSSLLNKSASLRDNFTNQELNLEEGSKYVFNVTVDELSWGDSRFEIVFNSTDNQIVNTYSQSVGYDCTISETSLTLSKLTEGQQYTLLKDGVEVTSFEGTTGTTVYQIPAQYLDADINTFDLKVSKSCSEELLTGAISVNSAELINSAEYIDNNITSVATYNCGDNVASVTLHNLSVLYNYKLQRNGTTIGEVSGITGESSLEINTELLTQGANSLDVLISNDCNSTLLSAHTSVEYFSKVNVSSVEGAASCGNSTLTLSATGAPEGGYYRWYESAEAVEAIQGENGASLVIPELSTSKTYFVVVVNKLGCESSKVSVEATINQLPQSPQVTDGTACKNSNASMVATGGVNGNYRWYTSSDLSSSPIANQVDAIYETDIHGDYYVSIVNENSCESERILVRAVTNEVLTPVVESLDNHILQTTQEFDTYRWFKDGVLIEGESNRTLQIVETGIYTVVVTSNGCESSKSIGREEVITGIINDFDPSQVLIYPNPIGDENITIDLGGLKVDVKEVVVTDNSGKIIKVLPYKSGDKNLEINFTNSKKGVYYIQLLGENDKFVYKILKY